MAADDNPAYRISRAGAERLFAADMAAYDAHQAHCPVCVPLPPGSVIPTTTEGHFQLREAGKICLDGGIVLWPAVKRAAGLKSGYYPPDHVRGKDGRCTCHKRTCDQH